MAINDVSRSSNGSVPEPVAAGRGAPVLGPRNLPVERANPDLLASPATDAGTVPNLKFPFAQARNRLGSGGWGREITTRELPVGQALAGVNMRLAPGGIRELHWHSEAEWAFMIAGRARVSAVEPEGGAFLEDVGPGDLWYFPAGIPHHIQGLGDGAEFLLVFDDGGFSENETFLLTDWLAHTPRDVLAQNLGTDARAFDALPGDLERSRWIFGAPVPPDLQEDRAAVGAPPARQDFVHRTYREPPLEVAGGRVRIVDARSFPVSRTVAMALVEVDPGGLRELHWHPNGDEWQYYLEGRARMTVFAAGGKARTFDYQAGDVGYVPFPMGHYVQNTGDGPLRFLELFRSDRFADLSLNQWLGLLPPALVRAHVDLPDAVIDALPAAKPVIVR